jgi:hypothetical protein
MGSVHEIKWVRSNIKHSDHLTIHDSRDGGATLVQNRVGPRVHVRLLVASGQLYYHSGQGEDDYATDNGTTWIKNRHPSTGHRMVSVERAGPATTTAKV